MFFLNTLVFDTPIDFAPQVVDELGVFVVAGAFTWPLCDGEVLGYDVGFRF